MESARIGGGRLLDFPIEPYLDEDGDLIYRVLLANGTQIRYMLLDPMPLETAQAHIRELVLTDIRNRIYDFPEMQRSRNTELLPDASVDEEASYMHHHGFSAVPASDKAIADLQETAVGEEGQCSVCLEDLQAHGATKLRIMPCSHSFHEDCIFTWLRVSHACPLCRFALPTQ
uniref:Uncharacterized protein n=1 Tax=Avena sativa TaxID=4498 RepID=A0ACD5XPI8_AVESA